MTMWKKLVALLLPNPSMCVLCESRTETLTICPACLARSQQLQAREGQCRRCGHYGTRAPVCDTCRDWPAYFTGNAALLPYSERVREAILCFKYHGEPWRAEGFATLFAERPAPTVDMIVPVPLHKARLRERGYNQSWLLAQQMAAAWEIPARQDLLVRTVNTRHQVGLSRHERMQNVAEAFTVPERAAQVLRGKRILLVDDVMTTGSTLLACARTLHAAGVREVQGMTLAAAIR